MEHEITVGIQSGNLMFSFKTDEEGSNLKEGFEAINRLIASHRDLLQRATRNLPSTPPPIILEQSMIPLSQLDIPVDEKEAIVSQIDGVNRFDLFMILLKY